MLTTVDTPAHPRSHRHRAQDGHARDNREHHRKHDRARHRSPDRSTRKRKRTPPPPLPCRLPLGADPISKHDLQSMKPLLASYLDIQKQLFLEDLSEDEVKGRWKSFVNKWNRAQLAEGWYDPSTKRKAIESFSSANATEEPPSNLQTRTERPSQHNEASDSDEDYGPVLPDISARHNAALRPSAPNFSQLAFRADQSAEDAAAQHEDSRSERKLERKEERDRLDELVPRADPGTRERQLEKKADKAASARAFKDAKGTPGDMQEVPESDLMGGDGGGVEDVKRMKKEAERKRTDREQRKMEVLQARAVEREERLAVVREKETKTMEMLKAIAKERFG